MAFKWHVIKSVQRYSFFVYYPNFSPYLLFYLPSFSPFHPFVGYIRSSLRRFTRRYQKQISSDTSVDSGGDNP